MRNRRIVDPFPGDGHVAKNHFIIRNRRRLVDSSVDGPSHHLLHGKSERDWTIEVGYIASAITERERRQWTQYRLSGYFLSDIDCENIEGGAIGEGGSHHAGHTSTTHARAPHHTSTSHSTHHSRW